MTDLKQEELKKTDDSQARSECKADCPDCPGGTCFLEMGHPGLHHCSLCGNSWETFHHFTIAADF